MTDDELRGWVRVSSGKVRDIYAPADQDAPDRLLLVTSDRISAFDYILPTPIPGKGKILNQLAIWWMDRLRDIVENHLLATAHDPLDPYSVPEGVEGRAVVADTDDQAALLQKKATSSTPPPSGSTLPLTRRMAGK